MPKDIEDLFGNDDSIGTDDVAPFAGISASSARAHASDIGVRKIGQVYVWSRADVQELRDRLDADNEDEDDDDDEDDSGEEPDEEEDDVEDEDNDELDDEDLDDEDDLDDEEDGVA